jgi:hypothetical protein
MLTEGQVVVFLTFMIPFVLTAVVGFYIMSGGRR